MKSFKHLIGLAMVLFAICGNAQVAPYIGTLSTSTYPTSMPGGASSNCTSTAITVLKGNGIAFYPTFVATNALSTVDLVFTFNVSLDGTTYTTTDPLTYTVALNGTNTVVGYKLFTPSVLDHARNIRLTKIAVGTGTTNATTINSLKFGYFR